MDLDISTTRSGDWNIVAVGGEVDLASAPTLRRSFEEAAEGGTKVIADLTSVKFMDSTGLRVLIAAHQDMEASGAFAVVPGDGPVARLLTLTGVDKELSVFDTVDAATSS